MALLLSYMLINAVDVGMYVYTSMQVQNAAQVEGESIFTNCVQKNEIPVTVTGKCTGYAAYVTTAGHSTSLGSGVTAGSDGAGAVSEAWYCESAGVLTQTSTTMTTPPACTGKAGPYDYVKTSASYRYTSVFPGATVVSLLTSPISSTAMIRIQ